MTDSTSSRRGQPHDDLFRNFAQQPRYFRELLFAVLSDQALSHLDLETVVNLPTDYYDDRGNLLRADAVGRVDLKVDDSLVDQTQQLIVVCEHKSTAESNTLNQLGSYVGVIQKNHPDAWVLAVIVYNGASKWRHDLSWASPIDSMPPLLTDEIGFNIFRCQFVARFLDVSDPEVLSRTEKTVMNIVFDALGCRENIRDEDVQRLLVKCTQQPSSVYIDISFAVVLYIIAMLGGYDLERLNQIGKQIFEQEGKNMEIVEDMPVTTACLKGHRPKWFQDEMNREMEEKVEERVEERVKQAVEEKVKQAVEEKVEKYRKQHLAKIAEAMSKKGMDENTIVECLNLSPESFTELKRKLNGS